MSDVSNPHDAFFIRMFSVPENAAPELRTVLPSSIATRIDWRTLRHCPGSFVDETLKGSHSDLLYEVQLLGRRTLLYVLFEHKSWVEPLTALQMWGYVARVLEQHLRERRQRPALPLPLVLPILLHHSETGWTASRSVEDLFDTALLDEMPELRRFVPKMEILVDDISNVSDDELNARALGLITSLTLWALRDARNPERLMASLGRWAQAIADLFDALNGREALATIFRYISQVSGDLPVERVRATLRLSAPKAEEAIMTLAQQWIDEGRAEGRTEVLLRLITLKFGPVSDAVRKRIQEGSKAELEHWTERILTANSLEEMLGS